MDEVLMKPNINPRWWRNFVGGEPYGKNFGSMFWMQIYCDDASSVNSPCGATSSIKYGTCGCLSNKDDRECEESVYESEEKEKRKHKRKKKSRAWGWLFCNLGKMKWIKMTRSTETCSMLLLLNCTRVGFTKPVGTRPLCEHLRPQWDLWLTWPNAPAFMAWSSGYSSASVWFLSLERQEHKVQSILYKLYLLHWHILLLFSVGSTV